MSAEIITTEFTAEEARQFTDEIRADGQALWEKVSRAYEGGVWIALGYEAGQAGWMRYVDEELNKSVISPPKDRENEAIAFYREQGHSNRVIASFTNLSPKTIDRRVRELEDVTEGGTQKTSRNVRQVTHSGIAQETSSDTGIEDAEIVDEGERPEPASAPQSAPAPAAAPQPPTAEPATEYLDIDDVDAGEFGVEPMELNNHGGAPKIDAETVKRSIREYHMSGSSDTAQIKKTAGELRSYLESGMVEPSAWDEDELSVLAEDSGDVILALCDLLLVMAQGGQTQGTSTVAVQDSELVDVLPRIKTKLNALDQALTRQPAGV